MTTSFDSLPIVDLSPLRDGHPTAETLQRLSTELYNVFTTTGFAYLTNAPLSFSHDDVFGLAGRFFQLSSEEKMKLAKKSFVKSNNNTYRGYFPPQPGQKNNLKEGFEVGFQHDAAASDTYTYPTTDGKFNLGEPNVWPAESSYPDGRVSLEKLHSELQSLSAVLLSLLAMSLGKPADFFASYLPGSISTLRLLHYPPQGSGKKVSSGNKGASEEVELCCTPHTDSGILTLLHQDCTGGLEVLSASSAWVPAPYMPGSIVVNIGDLLSRVSGDRFVATMHRVRINPGPPVESEEQQDENPQLGRLSVPFFFEPGEACVVTSIDGGEGIIYGEHVRSKMGTWVEFQDQPLITTHPPPPAGVAVEVDAA